MRPLTTILCLFLTLPALAAQQPAAVPYSAETYGDASGDVPLRGLGLVLELVDGGTSDARLRLFGGRPGTDAAILVSPAQDDAPTASGGRRLVGDVVTELCGTFDWQGTFEVPLAAATARTGELFAQGVDASALDLGPGGRPLSQRSNGLHAFPTPTDEPPQGFDDLRPHLPARPAALGLDATLGERLQRWLNSAGDTVRIQLHGEGRGGSGAFIGGELDLAAVVSRTTDDAYELRLEGDVAVAAGVELADPLQLQGKGGVGTTDVFRFHSAPGLARGLLVLVIFGKDPGLQPLQLLQEQGLAGDPAELVQALQAAVDFAEEHADEAEALLCGAVEERLRTAQARRTNALAALRHAQARFAAASWHQRPARAAAVAVTGARFAAAHAAFRAGRSAYAAASAALDSAQDTVERRREELRTVLAAISRAQHAVGTLQRLRPFVASHYAGAEVRFAKALELELGVPLPVDVATLGAGLGASVSRTYAAWFPVPDASGRQEVTVSAAFERAFSGEAILVAGVDVETARTVTIEQTLVFGEGRPSASGVSASLERASRARARAGQYVAHGLGAGRNRAFTLQGADVLEDGVLAALVAGSADLPLDAVQVGMELQDHRLQSHEFDLIVSGAGNGGGIEIDAEWHDAGRRLERATSVQDAVTTLVEGAAQGLEPIAEAVRQN